MPVTIKDVAQASGVSIKSVSRVVNREANVREALRLKVQAAIDDLGYVPNLAARSLATGRPFAIGVLFDNPSPNYTMKAQEGAYAACRRAGFQLVIEHINTQDEYIQEAMEAVLHNRLLDAMIVTPPVTECEAVLNQLEAHQIRYARISPVSFPDRSPSVFMDDERAAGEVVRHLLDLEHRNLAIVNGPSFHGTAPVRQRGFLNAIAALGSKFGPDPIAVTQADGDFTFQSGIAAGLQLLRSVDRPTGIFCANDDMAAGVYTAARQIGLSIPHDLSVVGFDDSWIAQSVWPALTTIHQPIAEMMEVAVNLLVDRTKEPSNSGTELTHQFVIRDSTSRIEWAASR